MKSFLLLKCKLVSPRVKQEPQTGCSRRLPALAWATPYSGVGIRNSIIPELLCVWTGEKTLTNKAGWVS